MGPRRPYTSGIVQHAVLSQELLPVRVPAGDPRSERGSLCLMVRKYVVINRENLLSGCRHGNLVPGWYPVLSYHTTTWKGAGGEEQSRSAGAQTLAAGLQGQDSPLSGHACQTFTYFLGTTEQTVLDPFTLLMITRDAYKGEK